jgi:acetolactate synthase-1/2/3 large subunit
MLRTLLACGVEVCFSNPGTSEMHFISALDRVAGMRGILGLFEGVVTGAADGYARMAGKPAATLLHLGPGLANGLANLHNARKAQVPVVNIIGDQATTHQRFDAPLSADVAAFARPVSDWVHASRNPRSVAADTARAVQAARSAPGQIATLIVPADAAWSLAERPAQPLPYDAPARVSDMALQQAATALRCGGPVSLLLRGEVLSERGLRAAGRIAASTGARLFSDTFAPRVERGAGRVAVERLPYRAQAASARLQGTRTLILVGTQAPVAFFAYPNLPSELTPPGCEPLVLCHPHEDGTAALESLADAIGASAAPAFAEHRPPELPTDGPLSPESIMRVVGHHLPENAVVSDESISSGLPTYKLFDTVAPHAWLQVSGGSIGGGMPLATGAAIACPDRRIVSLQADGSAMYTLQSLWTQAREKLDVTTVIFANRVYNVLIHELQSVGAGQGGPKAMSMLDLHNPELNWVKLAEGMGVEAVQVHSSSALEEAFRSAVTTRGPRLIEAVI